MRAQAGRVPEGKREGFFLKNPDVKEMHEAISRRKMPGVCGQPWQPGLGLGVCGAVLQVPDFRR